MTLIKCDRVTFAYDGKIATSPISFSVNSGDYLCIVGENGAGKTTLIKGILGLKNPASGSLYISEEIKNKVGYLPQQSLIQKGFPATSMEVVLSGCLNSMGRRVFYSKKEKNLALEKLEEMKALPLAKKSFNQLSGGQQQRVLLARALCSAKEIILLDEPTSGLDPLATAELYSLIENINKDKNITVITVSHHIEKALDSANKVLHICTPQKEEEVENFFGSCDEYMKSKHFQQFLGRRIAGV